MEHALIECFNEISREIIVRAHPFTALDTRLNELVGKDLLALDRKRCPLLWLSLTGNGTYAIFLLT